jgi:hypothetical protein
MGEDEVVRPVGTTDLDPDLGSRPVVFRPRGFLVAVLTDDDEARRAATALRAAGFADRELRISTGEQILADHARYRAQPSLSRRLVGALTDDPETLALHHGHARDGRAALWVHVADDDGAGRAVRGLPGCRTLHIRYHGRHRRSDVVLQRPTS